MKDALTDRCRRHYLVYSLGEESGFGVKTLDDREIIGIMDILQPFPPTAIQFNGGIELKGKILPLLDLRHNSDHDEPPYDERACIILVEIRDSGERCFLGVVVESISE